MFTPEQIQSFNQLELQIYEYIMKNSSQISFMSIRQLASQIPTSTASVLRFCKKIGYDSYNDFKYVFKQSLQEEQYQQYDFDEVIECLKKIDGEIYKQKMNEAIELLGHVDRVLFLGVGDSGIIGEYGARRFSSYGKFALAINDPYYNVNIYGENCAVIVLSISGETPELISQVNKFKSGDCKIIAITTTESSTVARLSDVTIPYYIQRKKSGLKEMTSQVPALSIVENIAQMLLVKRNKI